MGCTPHKPRSIEVYTPDGSHKLRTFEYGYDDDCDNYFIRWKKGLIGKAKLKPYIDRATFKQFKRDVESITTQYYTKPASKADTWGVLAIPICILIGFFTMVIGGLLAACVFIAILGPKVNGLRERTENELRRRVFSKYPQLNLRFKGDRGGGRHHGHHGGHHHGHGGGGGGVVLVAQPQQQMVQIQQQPQQQMVMMQQQQQPQQQAQQGVIVIQPGQQVMVQQPGGGQVMMVAAPAAGHQQPQQQQMVMMQQQPQQPMMMMGQPQQQQVVMM